MVTFITDGSTRISASKLNLRQQRGWKWHLHTCSLVKCYHAHQWRWNYGILGCLRFQKMLHSFMAERVWSFFHPFHCQSSGIFTQNSYQNRNSVSPLICHLNESNVGPLLCCCNHLLHQRSYLLTARVLRWVLLWLVAEQQHWSPGLHQYLSRLIHTDLPQHQNHLQRKRMTLIQ